MPSLFSTVIHNLIKFGSFTTPTTTSPLTPNDLATTIAKSLNPNDLFPGPISIPQPVLCSVLDEPFYYAELYIILLLFSLPILFFISAPYGKLKGKTAWTIDISPRWSWFIMEFPVVIVHVALTMMMAPQLIDNISRAYDYYGIVIDQSTSTLSTTTLIVPPQINLYALTTLISSIFFTSHYVYRSIIYPLKTNSINNNDLFPVLLAAVFNFANGLVQSVGMYCHTPQDITGLSFPLYVLGHIGFMLSWYGCYWSDMYLVGLRNKSTTTVVGGGAGSGVENNNNSGINNNNNNTKSHYIIPTRGLFQYSYSANYCCEFLQWVCFALMVPFSPERWLFVALTFCNLFPRGYQYRQFYLNLARERGLMAPKIITRGLEQDYYAGVGRKGGKNNKGIDDHKHEEQQQEQHQEQHQNLLNNDWEAQQHLHPRRNRHPTSVYNQHQSRQPSSLLASSSQHIGNNPDNYYHKE